MGLGLVFLLILTQLRNNDLSFTQIMMEHAEDQLFNGYLRRNMARIVTKVKVREILPHLPCLTQSDREQIEVKRDHTGNYNAMELLLCYLRRKDNWLEEFLSGLRSCDHSALAVQIQEEYETLKVQCNGNGLAPLDPVSDGSCQPPLDPSTTAAPEAETPVLAKPPPAGTEANGEALANHTDALLVPAQSIPEQPAASSQTPNGESGAVPSTLSEAPSPDVPSPAIPPPDPQGLPEEATVQNTSPPDTTTELNNAADKPAEDSMSADGQEKDQHICTMAANLIQEAVGVVATLTAQDATDGPQAPSCVGGNSKDVEGSLKTPAIQTSVHSVQVHRPFDSPSTFPPIPEEGPSSGDSVSLESTSTVSRPSPENVIQNDIEIVVPSDTESKALVDSDGSHGDTCVTPGDKETVAPGDAESVASGNEENASSDDIKNVTPENEDISVPDNKTIAQNSEVDNVGSGNTESTDPSKEESVVPDDKVEVAAIDREGLSSDETEISGHRESNECDSPALSNSSPENVSNDSVSSDDVQEKAVQDIVEGVDQNVSKEKNKEIDLPSAPTSNSSEISYPGEAHSGAPGGCDREAHDGGESGVGEGENGAIIEGDIEAHGNTDRGELEKKDGEAPANKDSEDCGEADSGVSGEGEGGATAEEDSETPPGEEEGWVFEGDSKTNVEGDSEAHDDREGWVFEGDSKTHVKGDGGALGDSDIKESGEAESETSGEEDNKEDQDDTKNDDPREGDSGPPGGGGSGASGAGGSGAPGNTDSGAPGEGDRETPGEGGNETPGNTDTGASGEGGQKRGSGTTDNTDNGAARKEEGGGHDDSKAQSGAPGEGDRETPGEGGNETPENTDTGASGEGGQKGVSGATDNTDNEATRKEDGGGHDDSKAQKESLCSSTKPEGHVTFVSLASHIPKSETPNEWKSTEPTYEELVENQYNSNHREISLPPSILPNHSPGTVPSNKMEGVTLGNKQPLHIEHEESQYSSVHLKISLNSTESFLPSTGTLTPDNFGSAKSNGTTSSNKQQAENHCNSAHLTISLSSAVSPNHKPDTVTPGDTVSLTTHKAVENHHNSVNNNEQDEMKQELSVSDDPAIQNHLASDETPEGAVKRKNNPSLDVPEQPQLIGSTASGNYYVPAAAVAGVVAAAMLWQLKK
ncbi:hypothetical protein JZ751_027020 [Albula glossodonta]|uniref:Mitochondrial antiviral-signaling protein n=1 Tax=Albula glossodonta TaxID=121402 RepID=A0A8T2NKI3_9TELE|nr:hypothetical protein JZ751_027020 [Albula glossodonta]